MGYKEYNSWAVFRFELDSMYQFPMIAAITCIFLAVGVYSALSLVSYDVDVYLRDTPEWDGSEGVDHLNNLVNTKGLITLVASVSNCVFVLMAIVPLLVAFNFAQGYSSGLIRTLLSYPIDRKMVLLMKMITITVLVALAVTIGSLAGVFFFVPIINHPELIILHLLSVWILVLLMVSVATFVAIITKSQLVTSFGCISFWVLAFSVITMPNVSELLKLTMFPPFAVAAYLGHWYPNVFSIENTILDVLIGMGMTCVLIIALFGASYFIFKYTGV